MSADRFFDTNVLFYALTSEDPRSVIAQSALETPGTVSVQVFNELTLALRRQLKLRWDEIEAHVSDYRVIFDDVRPLTLSTNTRAREIAERFQLRFYDSLLLASALEAGCARFISEDMQDGLKVDGLTVENPFRR